jgi:hypothetical protein
VKTKILENISTRRFLLENEGEKMLEIFFLGGHTVYEIFKILWINFEIKTLIDFI